MTGSWRWTPASDPADFWLGWNSLAPQVFPSSMTARQLTTGPERQFTCGPRVPWKERLRRVCEGTPPGFSFLLPFFLFFVRALILSPLSRVMGNVYVFSLIKITSSGTFLLCFLIFDGRAYPPMTSSRFLRKAKLTAKLEYWGYWCRPSRRLSSFRFLVGSRDQ